MSAAALVEVTFVDADSGEEFLRFTFTSRQLPESFAAQTTMNLGKDDWFVVEATPPTAPEFVASGKLRLLVRKVVQVNPKDLNFSLPTVADEIPAVVPRPEGLSDDNVSALAEDDWLQVELLPRSFEPRVRAELLAIEQILTGERVGAGFRKLHVRKGLLHPLASLELKVWGVKAYFEPSLLDSLEWRGAEGILEGGFGIIPSRAGLLYGEERDGRVACLGIDTSALSVASRPKFVAELQGLMSGAGLIGVDWCRARIFEEAAGLFVA